MYVDGEGKLHFVNGSGADTVIPFNSNKFCLEYEIDYSQYIYTDEGLSLYSAFWGNRSGQGYCIDGDYVHVNIAWAQGGNYPAGSAGILGFPLPAKVTPIYPDQIASGSSHDYTGQLNTDGKLVMNAANVYAKEVHWQFTYKLASAT